MLHQAREKGFSAARWIIFFPLCLLVSAAVLLNTASTLLQDLHPSAALRLNLLNAEARVNLALQHLRDETVPRREVQRTIMTGIRYFPIDARFYSLIGIVENRTGNTETASQFFDHALQLLPTEIQALTHKLVYAVRENDLASATIYIELIGRRWREHWPRIVPLLPAILSDDRSFRETAERFGASEPLRRLLIRSLSKDESTLHLAHRVLIHWHNLGVEGLDSHINHATSRLIQQKRYADAFLLFRLTRQPGTEREAGYVYNSEFRLQPSGNFFDWRLKNQAGVDFQIVRHASADSPVSERENHELVVRFLDNPIQFRNISQSSRLAPGRYRLSLTYAADRLKTPKPLRLTVRCMGTNRDLATMTLKSGSTGKSFQSAEFSVPTEACPLQQLYFFNDPMPMSWSNRYSGVLRIDSVSVTRMEG